MAISVRAVVGVSCAVLTSCGLFVEEEARPPIAHAVTGGVGGAGLGLMTGVLATAAAVDCDYEVPYLTIRQTGAHSCSV